MKTPVLVTSPKLSIDADMDDLLWMQFEAKVKGLNDINIVDNQ